ncbi:RnfH family protein [Pseudoduganella sp. GCM10020061]|uniref:RnfH family protein n=1 Tax=Pseudoduganella sp. GCM10020061 TaxID=3317345 RepID=UPI0036444F31
MAERFVVKVCYATAASEVWREVEVEQGATIEQAIRSSGMLEAVPGIDLAVQPVGIYAKKKPLDTVLREHDRIEIYRPLVADPKETRRARARKRSA